MALTTETVTINGKDYKHIYSDVGYYIKRNDNKLFMDVLQPTASTYTYTETTQIATQNIIPRMMKRMSTIETNHAALANLPHVTETYSQGTDWYRIYSDKWCEQSGYVSNDNHSSAYENTVTFLKSYKDTNYTFLRNCHKNGIGNDAGSRWITGYNVKSTDKITFFTDQIGYIKGDQWYASGYTN